MSGVSKCLEWKENPLQTLPIILYEGTLNQILETRKITNRDDLFPRSIVYISLKDSCLYVHSLTFSVTRLHVVDFGAPGDVKLQNVCEI